MIGCYVRVSTEEQNDESQKAELEKWLDQNGIGQQDVKWFYDKDTGTNYNRPGCKKLQDAISKGKIKRVLSTEPARLGRNTTDGCYIVGTWLDNGLKVAFSYLNAELGNFPEMDKVWIAFLLSIAEAENNRRKKRQRAGIEVAKAKGVYKGRKKGAYKKGRKPKRALHLKNQGLSYTEIARAMGVGTTTVHRYLKTGRKRQPRTLPRFLPGNRTRYGYADSPRHRRHFRFPLAPHLPFPLASM